MNNEIDSPFFDRNEEIEVSYAGSLPHWHQQGKMQSVTFRLADSLPQKKMRELTDLRNRFLVENPLPWDKQTTLKYYKQIGPLEHKLLDCGYGSCILKECKVREELIKQIQKGEGTKYETIAFVIMPNHVHIVLLMLGQNKVSEVIRGIKQYSAFYINLLLGERKTVWMKNYFDRIVRSEEALKHAVKYIIANPHTLPVSDYSLYINRNFVDSFGNWMQ